MPTDTRHPNQEELPKVYTPLEAVMAEIRDAITHALDNGIPLSNCAPVMQIFFPGEDPSIRTSIQVPVERMTCILDTTGGSLTLMFEGYSMAMPKQD